jgi:hypothetical protein
MLFLKSVDAEDSRSKWGEQLRLRKGTPEERRVTKTVKSLAESLSQALLAGVSRWLSTLLD